MPMTATEHMAKVFEYQGQAIRTMVRDGEPWWVAKDVCGILELRNITETVKRLDGDEFSSTEVIDSLGRKQESYIVNESGLYALILASRKPEARLFKRWITHEVIPDIRKHGVYATDEALERMIASPEFGIRLLTELQKERQQKAALQRQVAQLEPPAQAWEALAEANGDHSLREAAQILSRDPAIETGQNRLMRTLRQLKWVDLHGTPYQSQVDIGRLAIRTRSYEHPHTGEPQLTVQIRVTIKGLQYLHRHLGGSKPLDVAAGTASA